MTAMHEWLARESMLWWPSVADHLWQATLFVLIIFAACFLLRRGPAHLRHSFWLLASAKFLVPTGLLVFLAKRVDVDFWWLFGGQQVQSALLLQGITQPVSLLANSFQITVTAADTVRHNEIYCILTALWLIGFLTLLVVWGIRRRKFLLILRLGRDVDSGREWRALKRALESLGLQTRVRLVISPHKTEPTVCRVWKPVVMLPESIAEHLNDSELEAIMLHELVHIKRRDNLIGNLQMAVCALLWFHPLVWFISRKLFDEREQACDEKVLEIYDAPEVYASSILKVVRFCFGWNVAGVTGAGSGSNLRRRIDNIMSTNIKRRGASWTRLLASSFVGLALLVMVAAGAYSRAGSAKVTVAAMDGTTDELVNAPSVTVDQSGASIETAKPRQATPATQPSQPNPATQPSQPNTAAQPSQLNPAAQPSQPNPASQPSQPNRALNAIQTTSATPASAPTAPTEEMQDSSQGQKAKEKTEKKDKEVVKGELIEAPRPVYPDEAKKQKIEGTVTVNIVIGEEGKVISARAASGPEALHAASVEAAYKARFKPTTVDGKPAKVSGAMTYNFVLDEK